MYLSLFSNPIQSIARIILTQLVSHLSLPTLTITLFTTLYQVTRTSLDTVGIMPTLNTLFMIRRFISSNNVLSDRLRERGIRSLLHNPGLLVSNPLIEAIIPFLGVCFDASCKRVVFKLLNFFVISIIGACIKKMFFRLIKLLFTGFTLLTSSIIYWELPEFIRDTLPSIIKEGVTGNVKGIDEEFMETFTQVLVIVTTILILYKNVDVDTVADLLEHGYNGCILCN